MESDRTLRMLEKLKAQERRPNPLNLSSEVKVVKVDDVIRNVAQEQLKISRILNELENYEKSVVDGKYLNYYKNLRQKQEEFLNATESLGPFLEKRVPLFYQKVITKRNELLKKIKN